MNKLMRKINSTEFLFLFIIGILFYILNCYSISTKDDLVYKYICEDELFFKNIQEKQFVDNFSDILVSNYNHWKFINGRFLIHTLVQLFVCIIGFEIFKIINTIIFVLLVKYVLKLSSYNESKLSIYVINFFIFWLLLGLVDVGLGYMSNITYSINYLWSSAIYIYIYYLYQKYNDTKNLSNKKNWGLFIISIIAGMANESFSVGLSIAFFIYYIYKYKHFTGTKKYIIIGLWIGTIICCINPSNITRFLNSNNSRNISFLFNIYSTLTHYYIYLLPFLSFLGLLIYTKFKTKNISNFIKNNIILILTIPSTFLFLFLIGFSGSIQMFTSIILISIILICRLLNKYYINIYNNHYIGISLILLFSIHFILVLNLRYKQFYRYNSFLQEYINTENGIVKFEPLNYPNIIKYYGVHNYATEIHANPYCINLFYGNAKKQPIRIPLHIESLDKYQLIDTNKSYSLYDADWCFIIKLTDNINCKLYVTDQYQNWIIKLKDTISPFAHIPYECKSYKVNYNGSKYLIFEKTTEFEKFDHIKILE